MQAFWRTLRQRNWQQHIGHTLGMAWLLVFASLLLPREWRAGLGGWLFGAVVLALGVKEAAEAPENWERARRRWRAGAKPLRVLVAATPPEVVGWFKTLGCWGAGAWAGLRRQPPPRRSATQAAAMPLDYLRRSGYRNLMPMLLACTVADMLVVHFLIGLVWPGVLARALGHAGFGLLHLGLVMALLGDRYWMGQGRHALDQRFLYLRLGCRGHGRIARADILKAGVWRGRLPKHRLTRQDAVITPWAPPNVRLLLRPQSTRLRLLGSSRSDLRCLYLYVDEPQSLLAALRPQDEAA
ncbi:hypothetical protein LZ017_15080 [Pelomonas sp. CA6]|uniref:hypothetical protein n=1 Tax=Pelomonas sp. CA6 TaxID=2907999 RepID=UPI001F4C0056|nr:hypothetical protein [Pelomonas sp. CA6]MCH7344704.1 hypothetical protein [Pelomonas sp. CA6]